MRNLTKIVILASVLLLVSCFNKREPNYRFMPNMYESLAYETYQQADVFPNKTEAQLPVEKTISRGHLPYEYEDTTNGYEKAKTDLKNPLTQNQSEKDMKIGKELYQIYCAVCHGEKGDGKGILVEREKFLGVPSYKDREITQGSIYHVMYYGINSMGSYANQLNEKERWQVALYVESLRDELVK